MAKKYFRLSNRDGSLFDIWAVEEGSEDMKTMIELCKRTRITYELISGKNYLAASKVSIGYEDPAPTKTTTNQTGEDRICAEYVYGNSYRIPNY